jgi:hypothetical protein
LVDTTAALENVSFRSLLFGGTFSLLQQSVTFTSLLLASNSKCIKLVTRRCKQNIIRQRDIQGDSLARGPKDFEKSIPEFGETHSSVLGCERRPVSASIMSRSCFASFPVRVYKLSSHYLDNIIFIDNNLGPLATESPCTCSCPCVLQRCVYFKFSVYLFVVCLY